MSNTAVCQDFVQNAWKKDLCTNCFKTMADHKHSTPVVELSYKEENVGYRSNGFGKVAPTHRKNNVIAVQLWELGSHNQNHRVNSNCQKGDIKGILKTKRKNGLNNGEIQKRNGVLNATNKENGRRNSVVGFSDATPQVIGYGGHDYEWDDDQESSDEPSDLDSLENYDLSLEEKAISKLTDTNTQYNAENLNISKELDLTDTLSTSKTNFQTSYFVSSSNNNNYKTESKSINVARNFICSHLYGESEDVGASLEDFEVEDVVPLDTGLKQDKSKKAIKPGCDTAPSSTGRRSIVRPSVQDLFTKEEPVTAAEFAAVADKRLSPILINGNNHSTSNSSCSPYGIVPISSISSQIDSPPTEAPPALPESSPEPVTDSDIISERRPQTLAIHSNNKETSTGKKDLLENLDKVLEKRMNREYDIVIKSCHYASANVSNGVATPPMIASESNGDCSASKVSVSAPSPLPPTPLTSPYSSTAILKGIPSNSKLEDVNSKTKPPVTKPKPKIPAKPTGLASPTASSPEPPITRNESISAINHLNLESPSIEVQVVNIVDTNELGSEISKFSSQNAVDLNKRSTKRPAPRPPTDLPLAAKAVYEEVKIASVIEELKVVGCLSPKEPETVEAFSRGSANSSLASLTDDSSSNPSPYGVPSRNNNSVITVISGYRETPRDVNSKSKKSKFSLKKLLKFGSAREDHNLESRRAKTERRGKLEIIHPIDLIQTTRSDLANVSTLPSSPDSSFGSNGSTDRPILTKMTTFSSPPVSPGWNGVETSSPMVENTSSIVSEINVQGLSGDALSPVEDSSYPCLTYDNDSIYTNDSSCKGNNKPQPPPRNRNLINDEQSNHNYASANKDKPVRPPPPFKAYVTTTTNGKDNNDELDSVESGQIDELFNGKDKLLIGLMDYANLGDIRTPFVPKKPERWPSGGTMEITDEVENEDVKETEAILASNNVHLEKSPEFEPTYYAPPVEVDELDCEELYADQAVVVPSSESSQLSSLTSDSVSSSQSAKQSDVEDKSKTSNGSTFTGVKIYERVILKKGGLEKVYASSPTVLSPTEQLNDSGLVNEVDEMTEMGAPIWPRRKSCRLSLRKIKTVVHKNLEDNYGAVIAANHQTLTQIMEQVSMTNHATTSKAKMLEDVSLNWSDFSLLEDSQVTVVGRKSFYSAIYKPKNLETTLMVTRETLCSPTQPIRNPCILIPIAEFQNYIPDAYLAQSRDSNGSSNSHGAVWVMERMRVETVYNVAENLQLQKESDPEAYEREICFILLQLINGLKHLQVLGIEEIEGDLSDFLLVMKNNEANYRLLILPQSSLVMDAYYQNGSRPESEKLSLGCGALKVMKLLFNDSFAKALTSTNDAFCLIAKILQQERADSLSQAKRLLEYLLWGPSNLGILDAKFSDFYPITDQEQTFQRWLDLERANVLNNLIRTQSLWQIRLTIFEEYMLSFFVRTCAKSLREAFNQLQMGSSKLT
ncbi:hypothetical protein CHUAL_003364 [Chamberlinius hualienensis]